ncbi:MAG TPA: hypothetical protein VEW69_02030 [Alphaproteobacteria bacterium]|nr:hypothetical protein [Alphaproteobacteria bacterium]
MKLTKSLHPETSRDTNVAWRILGISIPATMVLSATLAIALAVVIDGCSSKSKSAGVSAPSQNSSAQSEQPKTAVTIPDPAPTVTEKKAVVAKAKKKSAAQIPTIAYKNEDGVSFRYPRTFKLMPAAEKTEKTEKEQVLSDPVPMNFAQAGGVTLATVGMPGDAASSFFKVSVNKSVTAEQCGQFSVPTPTELGSNNPVDTSDDSIPAKAKVHGVDVTKVETATEQSDIKYYHRFVSGSSQHEGVGACYEFALGVEESQGNTKTINYADLFGKLERILSTVKIKAEAAPAVTASVGTKPEQAVEQK